MLRAIARATAWTPEPVTVVTLRATDPVTWPWEKLWDDEWLTVFSDPDAPVTVMLVPAVAVFCDVDEPAANAGS
jgi:hypothetical protein